MLVFFRILPLVALLPALAWAAPEPGVIEVEVGPLKNLRGSLRCALYTRADGFPDEPAKAVLRHDQRPGGNTVRCRFEGLAPGSYAVSVLHDEDDDGRMTTGFLGVPEEGYGASNNKLPALSAPGFEDASFALAAGEKKSLRVKLKY